MFFFYRDYDFKLILLVYFTYSFIWLKRKEDEEKKHVVCF